MCKTQVNHRRRTPAQIGGCHPKNNHKVSILIARSIGVQFLRPGAQYIGISDHNVTPVLTGGVTSLHQTLAKPQLYH